MLALKHRQNKSQRQRVVIFSGSPVGEDEASLVKLGKKLKKNNVAVDVVAFANVEENEAKLQARFALRVPACARLCVHARACDGDSCVVVLRTDTHARACRLRRRL
jgi:hypothetical protein